ncbi:hypothetical protein EGW08_011378 [Elysia chlorotica]|uniref:Uncharacterized protein n=1 Tax=Elysia chlorotica TaxID=188477 RepID=A0A433TH55_ELYCH|nr:hypothetical protein EGW08_011378 [Elysia chlorotica]
MPHNNFSWSLGPETASTQGRQSGMEGSLAVWGSESDGSNHPAAVSSHPHPPASSSHEQSQNHSHAYNHINRDQTSLLQLKHSQVATKHRQQSIRSSALVQDTKLFYATRPENYQEKKSSPASIILNGSVNHIRASNSFVNTFQNDQHIDVSASETMQNSHNSIVYLDCQSMDGVSDRGSYTQYSRVGQQQKLNKHHQHHHQQQHQDLHQVPSTTSTNLSQGLRSSSSSTPEDQRWNQFEAQRLSTKEIIRCDVNWGTFRPQSLFGVRQADSELRRRESQSGVLHQLIQKFAG